MHVKSLKIKNFRALDDIEVEFASPVSVIIGPNASGKTTILEAIRLVKAVLAPRTQNETNQVLVSLGAASPHLAQRLFPSSIASKPNEPTIIKCCFSVTNSEIDILNSAASRIPTQLALNNSGVVFSNQNQIASYFTSETGRLALQQANEQVRAGLAELPSRKQLRLNLQMDWKTGALSGEYPTDQAFYSALEQRLDPSQTSFSYFPADRAMPLGEQPVQLGIADTAAQLESYNSQPQTKFVRLKHTIFSSIIRDESGRNAIGQDFELIFSKILRGRSLAGIGVNDVGFLTIRIKDNESGRQFDIDGLSSGEKGLILTFLIIARSVAEDGLILLDEPELHLNPAVSRDILQFLIEEFVIKKNVQAIICSHSAEILAGALESPHCQLFHLRDGTSLAHVRRHDQEEIRDALRRLGSSESEALLYRGNISVEGIHDAEILQAGFDDLFRRFRFRERGGRSEIEKNIRELQKAEKSGSEIGYHFFLFDHDRKPSALESSEHVRLLQLDRYCLENYLLDVDILTDLTRQSEFADHAIHNTTELLKRMKQAALQEINEVAARQVFRKLGLEQVSFDMSALKKGATAGEMAIDIAGKINEIEVLFRSLKTGDFSARFVEEFGREKAALESTWDDNWRSLCDGKRLFEQLRKDGLIKGDLLRLKKRIANEMMRASTETWRALESKFREFIGIAA